MPQSALVSWYEVAEGIHRRISFPLGHALCVLLVCAGYYAGALIGQSLRFPDSHLSLIWPPTAILLAALLLAPPRRWWIFLVAVSPVHIFVQTQDGVPALGILSQLAGNFGQALAAATSMRYFAKGEIRLDSFHNVIIFTLCAVILAPFAVSAIAAYLYVMSGWEQDYWYVWRARVLSNALSTLTIIPPVLMAFGVREPKVQSRSQWRSVEFALLTAGLVAGYWAFGEDAAGATLLCAPLPFLLWAAVRFDIGILSVSLLVTAYLAFLSTSNGQGPFATQSAAENVLALQLYFITISLSLMFLATLIRERRSSEDALRESEARYRALVMAEANIVWQANANGEGFLATPSWLELTGQSEDEVRALGWLNALHPKDRERSERLWKQAMAERRMYESEFQVRTRGGDYRYFHVQAVPILSSGGEVGEWIGAGVDITQQKDAALAVQRHRDELAHVTRITTMGELAASLAHELNQPLTAILSNAQAAQRFLAANPADVEEIRVILQDIVNDNRRASEVIHRLRELVKKSQLEVAPLELADVIRDVVLLIHSDAVLHNVNLVIETAPGSPKIQGDRVQLQQVMLNLLLNAFQAMKDSPVSERKVTVRTQLDDDSNTVILAVRDRGVGLKDNQLEKMFQPFYTTKSDGLGMGLAISRSIIEAHGGRLWAENNPDRGATLYFTVPVAGEVEDDETAKSDSDGKTHSYADARARSQA
ncbi:MAG: MASE1 domain-containing protein [Candidatus Binatia bacterium]